MPERDVALELDFLFGLVDFDAIQAGNEVVVPIGSSIFAVGRGAQADVFLFGDCGGNAGIFHLTQGVVRQGAGFPFRPRLLQYFRAQQTADVIGAERRAGHDGVSCSDRPDPVTHGADQGGGLFGDQGVAGVGNDDYGYPVGAQVVANAVAGVGWTPWIEFRLDVQHGR